jgi:5-formyltetrahydrofolate cyclo-ligase
MSLSEIKAALRQQFVQTREDLGSGQVLAASRAICMRLAAWTVIADARTILTYLAFRNELDLGPLFERLPGIRWTVPRIQHGELIVHTYDPARLIRHRFGMLEPAADLPIVAPTDIDVVLVPGVAFDRQGQRLGFGGGYYDRFLPATGALKVGVTYDQCLSDRLVADKHDQHMDWVVTPTQTIDCAASRVGSSHTGHPPADRAAPRP